jgi:pimeloyl-ACP methyl ester carboxylesterase
VDWGDNGPSLVLLHGDMRTSRSWDAVARELSPRFHVIALDARGHGDSDWTPRGYSMRDRVEDLAAFCSHIGLQEVISVGHSTGGAVVALCAQRLPAAFSRLVLMEPIVVLDDIFHEQVSARAGQPRRTWSSRDECREYLKRHAFAGRWRADVIDDVVEHETMELPDGLLDMKWSSDTFNTEDRRGDYYDLKPVLRDLDPPVLFITSEKRRRHFRELEPLAAELPGLHLLTVTDTDHNMYMERPDAVAQAITKFACKEGLPAAL